jgi:Mrp family chromosome partitioning ATPase
VIGPSDALQVARVADGVLFVVQAGKVRLKLLTRACSDLSEMGANMLGTVFNREKLSKDQRYYYHEYYRGKERKY